MELIFLVVGLLIGLMVMYFIQRGSQQSQEVQVALQTQKAQLSQQYEMQLSRMREQQAQLTQKYEIQLTKMQEQQKEKIKIARKDSVDRSRSVLKGKVAEQMAPILPGFDYSPSDARFVGDPIDYLIFSGYTAVKDDKEGGDHLEVVIADIKRGKSRLSTSQRAIARAVEAGRVRFEVMRVDDDGRIERRTWRSRSSRRS